jgi:MoaA/NifB/PqqE/SkfB family radical SAM enzyme
MHRTIDQLNVSITTNRGCNLRCEHCYIMPHVFKDPARMTKDTVRLLFDRVDELLDLDKNLKEVEWEAIGGETTLMPFEWWDEMLPYMLDRINEVNKRIKTPGSLNFLTNLMIRDERYFDLFNEYGSHPAFVLYTSWEPDTRRFGTRNKLFPKFLENMDKLDLPELILDVIMTKDVCDLGGKYVADTFVPHGVTDFSCKMLSPYGSGKAFFQHAMVDFASMSRFLAELDEALPEGKTYTPSEEALSSLYRGSSFQCNGNFYYDLSIEPDGQTHFNANQTAEERVDGGIEIELTDPAWARKVVFGNAQEAAGKLGLEFPECHQCEYLRFCNAGWWHYKTDQTLVSPFNQEECAGLKSHWDRKKEQLEGSLSDVSVTNHRNALKKAVLGQEAPPATRRQDIEGGISENDLANLKEFVELTPADGPVKMTAQDIFGRSPSERLVWYDGIGVSAVLPAEEVDALPLAEAARILKWQAYAVLNRTAPLAPAEIVSLIRKMPTADISGLILDAASLVKGLGEDIDDCLPASDNFPSGLVVDARNDELFRWLMREEEMWIMLSHEVEPRRASQGQKKWLGDLKEYLRKESAARQTA